jgi:acyl-CoA thioester hydrolase
MTGARSTYRARVEWMDTDAAGIHHNTAVIRYVESAEAALVRELGLDEYFATAPRVHWEIDYESALRFGQEVEVNIEVAQLGTSSMTLGFEIWGEPFGKRLRARVARGRYVVVHVSGSYGHGDARSEPWPPLWVQALSGEARGPVDNVDTAQLSE